jgi:hypothetical protein
MVKLQTPERARQRFANSRYWTDSAAGINGDRDVLKPEIAEGGDAIHEVKALLEHRVADEQKGVIVFLVHWAGETEEEATWEPEEEIQKGASEMLYDYWKAKGGRGHVLFTRENVIERYRPFVLLRHEKRTRGGFHFEVQWVGYSSEPVDTTWEPELKLKKIAPALLDEYWENAGGRDKFLERRGRAKRA